MSRSKAKIRKRVRRNWLGHAWIPATFRVAGVEIRLRTLGAARNLLAKFEQTPRGGERQPVATCETGMMQSAFSSLPMKLKTTANRARMIVKLRAFIARRATS